MAEPRPPGGRQGDAPRVAAAAATGFERGADDYERARPGYPQAAIDHLVAELTVTPRSRVLDLAAGTGKLTRSLFATGAHLVAVEPVPAMRRKLSVVCPDVEVHEGTAEAIPLGDATVDAVTVAQAFHWFDQPAALAEMARVLRPGGGVALIWNDRDASVDWVARFGEIVERHGGDMPYERRSMTGLPAAVASAGTFSPLEETSFPNPVPSSPDLLVARAASTSYVAALPDDRRDACLQEVRKLCATHPDLAGRDRFDFPHVTYLYCCHARAQPGA